MMETAGFKTFIIFVLCIPIVIVASRRRGPGRNARMERWREIAEDPNQPRELRGYLKNMFIHVKRGGKFVSPPGYELAHWRGFEAAKGFNYLFSSVNLKTNHKLQHRYDKNGKLLKHYIPKAVTDYMQKNPGNMRDTNYQRQIRDHYIKVLRELETRAQGRSGTTGGGNSGGGNNGGTGSGQGGGNRMQRSQYRLEQESTARRFQQSNNLNYNKYVGTPRAGGVELISSIPFSDKHKVKSVTVDPSNREVVVTLRGILRDHVYKFSAGLLESDELTALEVAVRQTTREGLLLSLQINNGLYKRTVDGVTDNTPARNRIIQTLEDADFTLCDLVFGIRFRDGVKTTSPVNSYRNPFDERLDLVASCANDSLTIDDPDCINVMNTYRKFATIHPYPTFQISEDAFAEADTNERIHIKGSPLLKINMRGIYTDWAGTVYYDDTAENCLAEKPFLQDFKDNYSVYKSKYPVFARVEQYAAVIALLLLSPPQPIDRQFETHAEESIFNRTSFTTHNQTEQVKDSQAWIAAQQEELAGRDNDSMIALYQLTYLSNRWFNLNGFQQSFEAAGLLLYSCTELLDSVNDFPKQSLIKGFIAKALLKIAEVVDRHHLSLDDLDFVEQYIFNRVDRLVLNMTTIISTAVRERLIIMRALDIAMKIAISIDDWSTAEQIAIFAINSRLRAKGLLLTKYDFDHIWADYLREIKNTSLNADATTSMLSCVWLEKHIANRSCLVGLASNSFISSFKALLDNLPNNVSADSLQQLGGYVFFTESYYNEDKQLAVSYVMQSLQSFGKFPLLEVISIGRMSDMQNQISLEIEDQEIIDCMSSTSAAINLLKSIREPVPDSAVNEFLQCAYRARHSWMGRKMFSVLEVDKNIMIVYRISGDTEREKKWKRILAIDTMKYEKSKIVNAN